MTPAEIKESLSYEFPHISILDIVVTPDGLDVITPTHIIEGLTQHLIPLGDKMMVGWLWESITKLT